MADATADVPSRDTLVGSLDDLVARSSHWGFLKTSAAMLATYAAVSFLLVVSFFRAGDSLELFVAFSVVFGLIQFILALVLRGVLKWPVHPFSMGTAAAVAQLIAQGLGWIVAPVYSGSTTTDEETLLAAVPIAVLLMLLAYARLRRYPDEAFLLPASASLIKGIIAFVILLRLFGGQAFAATSFSQGGALGVLGPVAVGASILAGRLMPGHRWRWAIWPMAAYLCVRAASPAGATFFSMRSPGDDEVGVLLAAIIPIVVLPAIFWIVGRIVARFGGVGQAITALRTLAVAETTGGTLVMPLASRREGLGLDLVALAVFLVLLWRAIHRNVSFEYSELVEFASGIGYAVMALYVLASLVLRVLRVRRLRIIHAVVAFIPATIGAVAVLAIAVFPVTSARAFGFSHDTIGILNVSSIVIVIGAALAFSLAAVRNARFSLSTLKSIFLFYLGALLADAVFLAFLGQSQADKFAPDGLGIGHVAAICVILAGGLMYRRHRGDPARFLVWPVVAIASGIMLRLLISAQGLLNTFDQSIVTGWGEVVLACFVGALAAEGAMLAKRIWWDKDPQARADAVRVRGAFLIVFGIWPVLVLYFVFVSVTAFTRDIADEVEQISIETEGFRTQAEFVGTSLSNARTNIEQEIAKVQGRVEQLRRDIEFEVAVLPGEVTTLARNATEAARRSATAAAAEAKAAASRTIDEVKEAIGDKLTIPPIDIGIGKIELPDLGIGKAIGNAMSGIFSGIDFSGMLTSFVNNVTGTILSEFEGPLAEATAIADRLKGHATNAQGIATDAVDTVRKAAEETRDFAQAQYTEALARARRLIVQVVFVGYHFVVLLFMLLLAALAMLAWRALNSLVLMVDRVRMGWTMLFDGRDAQAERAAILSGGH